MIDIENTVVVVTARMAVSGLPGAPMMDVNGQPLLVRADIAATNAEVGPVLVASTDTSLAEAARKFRLDVLMAPLEAKSHNAMAAAVLKMRDPARRFQHVVVLPCILAGLDRLALRRCLAGLANKEVDCATLAGSADDAADWRVEAPLDETREVAWLRGLMRSGGPAHVPVYAWTRTALERFAALKADPAEPELQRALDAGFRIAAVTVDSSPITVDTPQALEALRRSLKH